jgi:hypothetical protein
MSYSEFQKEELTKTEVGKFVLCEAKDDKTERLFIHRFNELNSIITKDGWWDTFTLSTKPCERGFYLAVIKEFRLDRNNYLNMVVWPVVSLGLEIDEECVAWDYFAMYGFLATEYKSRGSRERFNLQNLIDTYTEVSANEGYQSVDKFLFDHFLCGTISLEEISKALNEKYEIEKVSEDFMKNLDKYSSIYPLLVSKVIKEVGTYSCSYAENFVKNLLESNEWDYNRLKLGDEKNLLVKSERLLEHWAEVHLDQKRKKTEEKRKKKAS